MNQKQYFDFQRLAEKVNKAHEYFIAGIENMPYWAKVSHLPGSLRVPVSAKVEAEGLEVETWVSKKGIPMNRVHWLDGSVTEYTGELDKNFIEYDARRLISATK